MKIYERVLQSLKSRRENILKGNINCIPSPFKRFRDDFVGIEQGKYYLISGITKSAKTQLTSYLFLYNSVLYAYNNPNKINLKIFYYPLEETPDAIILRFMSFLLYNISGKTVRKSPADLKSTNENNIIEEEVLTTLESEKYQKILEFFESVVEFRTERHPYGIYKPLKEYADNNGIKHTKTINIIDNFTGEVNPTEAFDYYVPNNPKEYVMAIVDHISLIESEKGKDLRQSINQLSEYMILLRNRYNYIPVIIQQQSTETSNLEAFKANKIRPTMAGLSDSKYTAKDCNVFLGITNPHSFELPDYLGYDISKLKSSIRFLEVVLNRDGQSNGVIALYFDGCTNYFKEMPVPSDKVKIQEIIDYINKLKVKGKAFFLLTLTKTFSKWQKL